MSGINSTRFPEINSKQYPEIASGGAQAILSHEATTSTLLRPVSPLHRIDADPARLTRITVCTRPFRGAGPRIEAERIGDQLIVHNYGHGGSGWSLSWGSAAAALELALAGRDPSRTALAVIGCGALGLTAAVAAQRTGARVTIYAKERPPHVRSSVATGSWTPDSRCALTRELTPQFAAQWEQMTRLSWRTYEAMLSAPGAPIQFHDRYTLSELPPEEALEKLHAEDPIGFAYLLPRVADLTPPPEDLGPGQHPFPHRWARRNSQMIFNITAYSQQLLAEFEANGGKLIEREFHTPADLALLPERVLIHSTGFGARSLFGDTSLTPVRGQIAWLPPQSEIDYALQFDQMNIVARGDGIVVQSSEQGEATGFDNGSEMPDEGEAQRGVAKLASLYERMAPGSVVGKTQ